jgi:hypothetical protein
VWTVLNRILIGVVGAAGATILGVPGIATADDPPPLPDINAFPSAKPSEYAVPDTAWYAFSVPDGVTCVLDKKSGGYGCSGPIPAAPGGANLVTATLYGAVEGAKPLPPNTRISFRTISCGTDGVTTSCLNSINQSGFVISPAGSYTFG